MKPVQTTSRIAGALLLALLAAQVPIAPGEAGSDPPTTLKTAHGLLEIHPSAGQAECEAADSFQPCSLVILDGKVLHAARLIEVDGILPSREDPRLVSIAIHGGGNCCPPMDMLLDFAGPGLVTLEEFSLRDAEARADGTLALRKPDGKNELGDQVASVYAYVPGSGRPTLLRKIVEYLPATIGDRTYPDEILADFDLRKPILAAMGPGNFAAFRRDIGIQRPVSVISDRYVAGSGCRPDACPVAGGIFLLDRVRETAIILHFDDDQDRDARTARYWGPLDTVGRAARAEIEAWLRVVEIDWANVWPATD